MAYRNLEGVGKIINRKYNVLIPFSRSSGVRIKAPTNKDVLDLDQEIMPEPEPLRITAPPLPAPPRSVPLKFHRTTYTLFLFFARAFKI